MEGQTNKTASYLLVGTVIGIGIGTTRTETETTEGRAPVTRTVTHASTAWYVDPLPILNLQVVNIPLCCPQNYVKIPSN